MTNISPDTTRTYFITGAAGFIGFYLSKKLLDSDYNVIGIDNLNDYYDVNLKQTRLDQLKEYPKFTFIKPDIYMQSNVTGFFNILEACRHYPVDHLIYASSSSVYGANKKVPFEETDFVDNPVSLYAATKKSNELMAHTYSHLYNIPATGLRFFTV